MHLPRDISNRRFGDTELRHHIKISLDCLKFEEFSVESVSESVSEWMSQSVGQPIRHLFFRLASMLESISLSASHPKSINTC